MGRVAARIEDGDRAQPVVAETPRIAGQGRQADQRARGVDELGQKGSKENTCKIVLTTD